MNEMTEIILKLLWRFYPIAWLTTAIVRGLSTLTAWLEEEDYRCLLAYDRKECAWIGGWLALAEESEATAATVRKMLEGVLGPGGTATGAAIEGYELDWGLEDDISELNAASRIPYEYFRELARLNAALHVPDRNNIEE